jgi:hypothetical protein
MRKKFWKSQYEASDITFIDPAPKKSELNEKIYQNLEIYLERVYRTSIGTKN